ncbi:MAG: TonB-dependent receptor [candidate division WOR-3 bacterium]
MAFPIFFILLIFTNPEPIYELDTIYITAARYKVDLLHVPFSITILPKGEISLAERLLKNSGINLLDYGNLTTISLKGPSSRSTAIALNGIPLNSPQSGDFDISLLPSYFIDDGYIASSNLAGIHTFGNLGNTVAFYTKEKERSIILKRGSFGKIAAGGIWTLFSNTAGFYIEDNKNRFPYKDEFNNISYRENAHYQHGAGYWTSTLPFAINLFATFRDADVPEKLGSIAGQPHKNEKAVIGSLSYDTQSIRFGGSGNFYRLDYSDTIFGQDRHQALSTALDLSFKSQNRNIAFYLEKEAVSSTKIGSHSRDIIGIDFFQQHKIKLLTATPSAKMTLTSDRLFGLSILLPGLYFIKENLGIYHNLSFGYRYPTMNELYWPEDNFSVGNPNLKSEKEITVESGFRYIAAYFLKGELFFKFGRDIITWMPGGDGKWRPVNSAHFRAWGTDLCGFFEKPLKSSFGFSFFWARNDGSVLPYRPCINIVLNIEKSNFFGETIIMLRRPANPSGVSFLEDIYLLNLGYHWNQRIINRSCFIDLRLKNILDKNYQFVEGYPLPGRQYEITFKINL